jgi:hypothetical protein
MLNDTSLPAASTTYSISKKSPSKFGRLKYLSTLLDGVISRIFPDMGENG